MYRVSLINLPFANVRIPSIALTQLKYVTEKAHGSAVEVRILDVNHMFAKFFGLDKYDELILEHKHFVTGLGDWLFRQEAFPDIEDNQKVYFTRYYQRPDPASLLTRDLLLEKRAGIAELFDGIVTHHGLATSDLVGLTSMFSQNTACFAFARAVKRQNPNAVIVMGGANCEFPMGLEIVRNVESVDYVFSGPSLVSFPAFVSARLHGEANLEPPIPGIMSKRMIDLPPDSAKAASIGEALDIDVPIPLDYEAFLDSYDRYFPNARKPALLFETSRGCWWGEKSHCTFCGLNGLSMTYRAMDAALALEQFEKLFSYHSRGVEDYQCVDNIMPKSYIRDVLPYIDPPGASHLFYEVKADLSEAEVIALARARVLSIQPGIEALASSTLKLMKKGVTSFQNITLLKHCAAYRVRPSWNLLVGFPGEPQSVFEKYVRDIPVLTHLEPPSSAAVVRFDRFSPYFNNAEAYGLDLRPQDFYKMVYPFPKQSVERIAFYFTDNNFDAEYFVGMVAWLGKMQKAVAKWREKWSRRYTQRPRLEIRGDEGREYVFDSRGPIPARHDLTDDAMDILKFLQTQTTSERLASAFPHRSAESVRAAVATLRTLNLLFEEGERLMSIVIGRTESTVSFADSGTRAAKAHALA